MVWHLTLHTKIRLDWKQLPGTNTLAYFAKTKKKKFYDIDTWLQIFVMNNENLKETDSVKAEHRVSSAYSLNNSG